MSKAKSKPTTASAVPETPKQTQAIRFPHAGTIGDQYKDRLTAMNPLHQVQVLTAISELGNLSVGPTVLDFISDITGDMAEGMRADGLTD